MEVILAENSLVSVILWFLTFIFKQISLKQISSFLWRSSPFPSTETNSVLRSTLALEL